MFEPSIFVVINQIQRFYPALQAFVHPHVKTLVRPNVGGGAAVAEDALHACILLVERPDLTNQYALGGGTIVSRSRVITAAHVVRGATSVRAGFYRNVIEEERFTSAVSTYVQPIQHFVDETLDFDIAVVQFAENTFPVRNVISIGGPTPTSGQAFVAGYGFESPTADEPSLVPLLAPLTVAAQCTEARKATTSHFCASTVGTAVLCPGDSGAGIYVVTDNVKRLVSSSVSRVRMN